MAPLWSFHRESVRLTALALLLFTPSATEFVRADDALPVGEQPAANADDPAEPDAAEGEQSLEFVVNEVEHRRETKYLLRGVLENSGDTDVRGPVHVVFLGATSPGFQLLRPDGASKDEEPFVSFVRVGRVLKAGAKSPARAIQFELEAELSEDDLAELDFEFRIEGPEIRLSKRGSTQRGRGAGPPRDGDRAPLGDRDRDDPDRNPDGDREGASRNPDGDDPVRRPDGSDPGDGRRPDDPDRPGYVPDRPGPDRDGDGRPDGDPDEGDDDGPGDDEEPLDPALFFGTSKGVQRGEPVTTAYVKLHSAAEKLPKQIDGLPVAPQVTWAFESYGHAGKGGGPVANGESYLGRSVTCVPLDGARPTKGVVAGFDFRGRVRVGQGTQPASGLIVVVATSGTFARRTQGGTLVLDDQGRPIGTVVAGNGTFTLVGGPPAPEKKKVLFVGNSYTFGNELPSLVAAVAKAAGREIEVSSSTEGGATLRRHIERGEPVKMIQSGKFDYVVLQDQSLNPLFNRGHMWAAATELHAEISKSGARTLFFMTWARKGRPEMTKGLAASYEGIAAKLGAEVAPVGHAWHDAIENAGLDLHTGDGSHPNLKGSMLAAFVFHAKISGDDPRKVPGNFGLSPAEAATLKAIAAKAVGVAGAPRAPTR